MATIPDSQGNVTMGKLVCEVKQVFIHIPAEQSAAGFELKIAGLVRIVTKVYEGNILLILLIFNPL